MLCKAVSMMLISVLCLGGCVPPAAVVQLSAMKQSEEYAVQQFQIAENYRYEENFEKAYQHYRYAAYKGHQEATRWLGKYYYNGIGTDKNYQSARRIFEMLVQRDKEDQEKEAYLYLYEIYFYGKGQPATVIQGYKWMLIGTRNRPDKRRQLEAELHAKIQPQHIQTAIKYARNWLTWRKRDVSGI